MAEMPTTDDLETLLGMLCAELGLCFRGETYDRLVDTPPANAAAFADAVFLAHGLDPTGHASLYSQVRFRVAQVFDSRDY
jgi:hypothetical protein